MRPKDAVLVLTKPLGTGIIMAAHMQLIARANWVENAIETMTKSNRHAANLFAKMNLIAATDITGFGLARHALNLSKRAGARGCVLNLPNLPLLPGVKKLLSNGVRSSLHDQNREAVHIERLKLCETNEFSAHAEVLFDPQTSGGLLGVLRREDAQNFVKKLKSNGHDGAIIGHLNLSADSVQLTSDKN